MGTIGQQQAKECIMSIPAFEDVKAARERIRPLAILSVRSGVPRYGIANDILTLASDSAGWDERRCTFPLA